jgi:hypothetical protein
MNIVIWKEEVCQVAKEIIFLVEESPEGGYEARAMGYSIYTEADSLEELRDAARDAVRCHFEPDEMPQLIRFHFVKDEVLTV